MKRLFALLVIFTIPAWLMAQEDTGTPTALLKISNIHVELNGQKVEWDKSYEATLTDGVESQVILFEQEGYRYGCQFTYKKKNSRLKLVRRCFATKGSMEPSYSRQKKDMQEIRTSIPGSLKMRVVENIVVDKASLEAVNVSFNYELIYKK